MSKLKVLNAPPLSFEDKQALLEKSAVCAVSKKTLRGLKRLPAMDDIAPGEGKWLKIKALKYIITEDEGRRILKGVLKRPLYYTARYIRSFFTKKPYYQTDDFFFYGIKDKKKFIKKAKQKKLLLGFSYCQKPHECPSGRFNDQCIRDHTHPVCNQCDIARLSALAPKNVSIVIIPTVHHIGNVFFDKMPEKPLFIITACKLTLKMFADFGNMLGIEGIGIRLDGRICNTMKAFELSERGIKPGLTTLTPATYQQLVELFKKICE